MQETEQWGNIAVFSPPIVRVVHLIVLLSVCIRLSDSDQ